MTVVRIVADVQTIEPAKVAAFYSDLLDMKVAMDQGWIVTVAGPNEGPVQLSFGTQGGSGTALPDLSIEVDNFEDVLNRVKAKKINIEYGPVLEPWGVRRFYLRDPADRLVNILTHEAK